MAVKVDAARPAAYTVSHAAPSFMQPTSAITYNRAFDTRQSVVDAHVPVLRVDGVATPPAKTSQTAMPVPYYVPFWLPKVVKTKRMH